uniref:Uncharacterized protein n=1 Tax=Rhizophora mucronata TaxID=61149 RepID=A0A2P2JH12_RHIMU
MGGSSFCSAHQQCKRKPGNHVAHLVSHAQSAMFPSSQQLSRISWVILRTRPLQKLQHIHSLVERQRIRYQVEVNLDLHERLQLTLTSPRIQQAVLILQ